MRDRLETLGFVLVCIIVFIILQGESNRLPIPPETQKQFQEWKKVKVRIFYPKSADFNCDGIVNFKDFAILANEWLEE